MQFSPDMFDLMSSSIRDPVYHDDDEKYHHSTFSFVVVVISVIATDIIIHITMKYSHALMLVMF